MKSMTKGALAVVFVGVCAVAGCGGDDDSGTNSSGGAGATSGKGGGATGGMKNASGGASAGKSAAGGASAGKSAAGGASAGKSAAGGAKSGTGGAESGGAESGGAESGGAGAGAGMSGAGGSEAGAGGASDAEVAACEASVDAVHAACDAEEPGAPRLCVYDAYRPFCATGRTAIVKAIFDCLKLDACQTPGDPSDAGDCVHNVVLTMATAGDRALAAAVCTCNPEAADCSANPLDALADGPDAMLLAKTDENAVTTCVSDSCDYLSCLNASPLGTANACPGL